MLPPGWAKLSPDAKKIAYMRDGVSLHRKGYKGASAYRTWIYDIDSGEHNIDREQARPARSAQ